jgi:hypothetical protein
VDDILDAFWSEIQMRHTSQCQLVATAFGFDNWGKVDSPDSEGSYCCCTVEHEDDPGMGADEYNIYVEFNHWDIALVMSSYKNGVFDGEWNANSGAVKRKKRPLRRA